MSHPHPLSAVLLLSAATVLTALGPAAAGAAPVTSPSAAAPSSTADAEAAPAAKPSTDRTVVTQDPLPTVQIDGVVWAQVTVGKTVYAVGRFANARPAGAAAGTRQTPRGNILAYDITTGNLITSFVHSLDNEAQAITASPDGSTIYVGGIFTHVDGQSRSRIAAFSTATGALLPYAPKPNLAVYSIAVTKKAVYFGGSFSMVGTATRTRVAATDLAGTLLPWTPTANNYVRGIVVSPDRATVVLGGTFSDVDGTPNAGLAAVDATTGRLKPFAASGQIIAGAGTTGAGILSLKTDGHYVYGASFNFQSLQYPQLEGTFAVDFDGRVAWVNDCWGDSYDAAPIAGVLYVASHAHNCSGAGYFGEQAPRHYYALAYDTGASPRYGVRDARGWDYSAFHTSSMRQWNPAFTTGQVAGQAVWSFTGTKNFVAAGGEFPTVNGIAQQGLVRFAVHAKAPDKYGPTGLGAPSARQTAAHTVAVSVTTAYDPDDGTLTYALLRDGDAAHPVATSVVRTVYFWQVDARGPTTLTDPSAPSGTHAYQVRVTDGGGSSVTSNPTSLPVSG